MTWKVLSVAAVCLLSTALSAQAPRRPQRLDLARLGPRIGQTVPDFRLRDAQGKVWTRDAIMGPNGAMLVFSRSVDWCPYCKTQMIELQSRLDEIRAQGLGLAVVTYDPPAIMADFSRRRGITFPLLSDPGSRTIRAYGILNTTVAAGTPNYGIPFPGTFVIDRAGRVTARFFEEAYQERNTVSTIMIALGKGTKPRSATHIAADHLDITTYLSDDVVAPGSLFSIVFEVVPAAGVHVYAPGARDYRVIAFTIDGGPLLVARPLRYPASEIYEFKPLNERVPVFQKPFHLVQTLAVSATPEARAALRDTKTLTIRGTLQYQACDNRVCFVPKSIPVSYSVALRQLDTERAAVAK